MQNIFVKIRDVEAFVTLYFVGKSHICIKAIPKGNGP